MNIAIIGAGIGGLATAIFLARRGYSITIYEQANQPCPVGAGFLLQPPGQEVLKKLGVYDSIANEAVPVWGLESQTLSGRKLLDLSYRDLSGLPRHGLGIQRNNIFSALYNAASKLDDITFKWDHQVKRCNNGSSRVEIITNLNSHKHDLCILSSGTNSDLANLHFPARHTNQYSWGCLWATIELPKDLVHSLLHQRCQRAEKMMGILPVRKTEVGYEAALYWSMKTADLKVLEQERFTDIKKELESFWPEATSSIAPLGFSDFTTAFYNDVWIPKPYNNRIIAIGDICHGTSPQLGQGCTMALLDAASLAKQINENALNDSLKTWWATRKNQLAYVRFMSRFLTPLYQSDKHGYSLFRDQIMAPMGRMPGLYTLQLKTLASEVFLDAGILG